MVYCEAACVCRVPFQELEKDYRCPVCNSPKRRFVQP